MKIYFYGYQALVRTLAAGHVVWCAETSEGFQLGDNRSLSCARRIARCILNCGERKTFYFVSDE